MRGSGAGRLFVLIACIAASGAAGQDRVPAVETTPLGAPAETLIAAPRGDGSPPGGVLDAGESLKTLLALVFVLGVAVAGAASVKKLARGRGGLIGALGPGGPSPSGVMEILGRYPVGSGQTLVLLRLDRRVLLLHQTVGRKGAQMRTLSEVADPEEVASILLKTREEESERVDTGFREAMRRLESDFSMYETASADETRRPGPQSDRAAITASGAAGEAAPLRARLGRWIGGAC